MLSNEEVLSRAGVQAEDIDTKLVRSRLRWHGHTSRMNNGHIQNG